jgi:uncharacterized protein YfcZ (UPF0381/DUF406 family)
MSFNLDTEEGRLRRNLNIYSISTSKAVGKRIEQLNQVIKEATAGRVDYKHDDKYYDLLESVPKKAIEKLEESKAGKTESEIAEINKKIEKHQEIADELNADRLDSIQAEKYSMEGFEIPQMTIPAKKLADKILSRYKTNDNTVEELELKEKLESALQDLPKLLRRKEEALELFAVAKDPKAFNNF